MLSLPQQDIFLPALMGGTDGEGSGRPASGSHQEAGEEVRAHTLEAESVVPGQRVWKARLVGIEVDGSHTWLVPAAGGPRGDDGVAEAAVRQPAGIALVQAAAPGGVELAGGGERGVLRLAELQRLLEGELLQACREEYLPWGRKQVECDPRGPQPAPCYPNPACEHQRPPPPPITPLRSPEIP